MGTQAPPTEINTRLRQKTNREFGKRMFIKVLAVVVVVGAFNFIRGIEATKRGYDETHNRPIVIVDQQFWKDCYTSSRSSPTPTPSPSTVPAHAKCGDARLIDVELIRDKLVPGKDLTSKQARSLGELVDKIKYQNFQGESDILQRLDAEILTAADYSKRGILTTLESERKSVLNKQAELKQDERLVEEKLKQKHKEEVDRTNKDPKNPVPDFETWLRKKIESSSNTPLPTDERATRLRLRLSSSDVAPRPRTKLSGLKEDELISLYRR